MPNSRIRMDYLKLKRHFNVYSEEFLTIEIMLFIRPTRGHGGPHKVKAEA